MGPGGGVGRSTCWILLFFIHDSSWMPINHSSKMSWIDSLFWMPIDLCKNKSKRLIKWKKVVDVDVLFWDTYVPIAICNYIYLYYTYHALNIMYCTYHSKATFVLDTMHWDVCQILNCLCILFTCKVMVGITGIISLFLSTFSTYMWAYLTACALQSFLLCAAIVSLGVLYFQPLQDCAGLAASVEVLSKHGPPPIFSMFCTNTLINSGEKNT